MVREEEWEEQDGQGGRGGPDQMGDICSFHSLSEEPMKLTRDALLLLLLPLITDAGKRLSKQEHSEQQDSEQQQSTKTNKKII